jgi:hypothetical protein
VESKPSGVWFGAGVAIQAMRYNMVLDVRWLMLTNGGRTLVFRREGSEFKPYPAIPSYEQMLCLR